jgi:beta-lactamase regulating signal transducer with metallopeptidase domain
MPAAFIEAALRSFVFALVVWAGLRIFRIHNVVCQRMAWTTVLAGSLLMPWMLIFAAHWSVLSFATVPAPAPLNQLRAALAPAASTPTLASSQFNSSAPAFAAHDAIRIAKTTTLKTNFASTRVASAQADRTATMSDALQTPSAAAKISLVGVAALAYFAIAGALLVRLLYGLATALRLWSTSTPVTANPVAGGSGAQFDADLKLRTSHKVSTPVTIGSGIVLPASYRSWTEEKLRIVLAHERSHVRQHDFHLQILASLYAALVWFSPLGWWLKRKLSDLGEAISDRSGLDAASSRSAYAQVLLDFAAAPRPTLIGVAMARPSSISRRIERLLNDSYLRHAFAGGRARAAVLAVPVVLFAATALVRVQAATTQPAGDAQFQASTAVISRSALAIVTGLPPHRLVYADPSAPPAPTAPSSLPTQEWALATPPAPPSPAAPVQNAAAQAEATFDRNLTFSGKLDLSVATGAGNITLTRGSGNQLRIHGIVKAGQDADPAQVQQIVANPPIEQNGNVVRIGGRQENLHNISISYEIEAPADTALKATSGSGNIMDTGVGQDAKLTTGSGKITATGIEGGFKVQTGSGSIVIEGSGQGDAKAQTGSGSIELKGVNGSLQAQTGSGSIKVTGTPSAAWKVETGSGSIELFTGNAPMSLDASVGSGRISTDSAMAMQTSADHHHVTGQLNGGGPEVRIETGSGDIRIH